MGICLIADIYNILNWSWVILQVALGLGLVIFVHELGHFVVAKLCGVKCEKFFIGFDIGGYKLSRKWGETEYGIGILPLGGYVKMLGQDDNPANIAEQMENSKVDGRSSDAVEVFTPDGRRVFVDPRSYLAKTVPQRMAIISAGVVMNVIFAFIFAVIAFGLGVPYMPAVVSETVPASPAYQANLRTGQEFIQMGDRRDPSFLQLTNRVTLADLERGLTFLVRDGKTGDVKDVALKPRQQDGRGLARIGIVSPHSLRLMKEQPAFDDTAAAKATPELKGGDEIIRVNGQPVTEFRQLAAVMARSPEKTLTLIVRRDGQPDPENPFGPATGGKEVTVKIPAEPMSGLGLVMKTGPIVAVQPDSPASNAGLRSGDIIEAIDGHSIGSFDAASGESWDLFSLSTRLRKLANRNTPVTISIQRPAGEEFESLDITLRPRTVDWIESMLTPEAPLSIPEFGIAVEVLNEIVAVQPGSPAEGSPIRPGDQLIAAELTIPKKESGEIEKEEIELGDERNWPSFVGVLQQLPANTKVTLRFKRGNEEDQVTLSPARDPASQPAYFVERGLILEPLRRIRIAANFSEQLRLGADETLESLLLVYRFLQKLGSQVPITALGGPITIAKAAGMSAFQGMGSLLIFLTLLSANLAVVNFLPIPLLDGGHMVFLAYEGIFRRPANEKFVMALHTAGFVFIISLMVFLIALDVGLIDRGL